MVEAIELALKRGSGRVNVYALADEGAAELWRWSTGLHCPESDLRYADPQPALFSFNSAFGACDTCRGFGRVIGVDLGLVIPDERKTLRSGAIKPIQTPAWKECQDDLMKYAGEAGIPRDTAWSQLTAAQRDWVIDGSPQLERQVEPAVVRRAPLLRLPGEQGLQDAHPRALVEVPQLHAVHGLRRRAAEARSAAVASGLARPMPMPRCRRRSASCRAASAWSREQLEALRRPGAARPDAAADRPAAPLLRWLTLPDAMRDEALKLLLDEIRTRLKYLCDVGLGYLTLDRQSRTL